MMNRLVFPIFIALVFAVSCTQKEPEVQVKSVSVSPASKELTVGETLQLSATVSPNNATNKEVIWSSSSTDVATVSSTGLVTATSEGKTVISANANGKKGECSISVNKKETAISEIKLNKSELTLYEGEEEILIATIEPDDATNKEIFWESSDNTVATVEAGKVTAVKKGEVMITAKAGEKSSVARVVVLATASGISLNKDSIVFYVGGTETLYVTAIPENATLKEDVSWSSSDSQVATVENGTIIAQKEGSATITASADGFDAECVVTVIKQYESISITDLKPVDILPLVGNVTRGDKRVYNHLEHLRLAEATRIIDMMWEYGAGNKSRQQYQQLMGRLHTGMMGENPGVYNYEIIGGRLVDEPSSHSYVEWYILTSIVKHATFIVWDSWNWDDPYEYCYNSPFKINIMGMSVGSMVKRDQYDAWNKDGHNQPYRLKNGLLFCAAGNVKERYGVLNNKLYQQELDLPDESSLYGLTSDAHSKDDAVLDKHLLITVATNRDGDIDQTNERGESSLFPVGFHDKVLFSGRILPYKSHPEDELAAPGGKYNTSFTNYVNVVLADLCFQLYAEVPDVDELLEMIRSTALTDYIRFDLNGDGDTNDIYDGQAETQPLQLINPAGLYKTYLTPQNLPSAISAGETLTLEKGYYKGVLFNIPGAEVKVNGEWIPYEANNKDIILSLNPMTLEWRLNGELMKMYGYKTGQTIEGHIITVDDKWGGLRLEVPMTIQFK